MDAMEAILTRRSVRTYTPQSVTEDEIAKLLDAAMSAPSSNNRQPWQFVVLDDRRLLNAIPAFHPYSKMLRESPLAICVCADVSRSPGSWVQDCAAATENILIAARAMGLGSVWLGIHPAEDRIQGVRDLLGLPPQIAPLSLVAIGHTTVEQREVERYDEARVHRNAWGRRG